MFLNLSRRRLATSIARPRARWNSTLPATYAEKLKARLDQEGVTSLDELKTKLKNEGRAFEEPKSTPLPLPWLKDAGTSAPHATGSPKPSPLKTRRDDSPIKPLSEFLNLDAINRKPHTAEQISALWTLYHASRSKGTGRGYISAVVPIESYDAMLERAKKYPMFVLPLPRPSPTPIAEGETEPTEFHFMQWGFHPAPPPTDPFAPPSTIPNPQTSTILFTPLIQYKLHQTYAPPYLVISHHTDFARSHGIVLLRGEITPSASVGAGQAAEDGQFMLSQLDTQLLAFGVQRFYLPKDGEKAEEILETFHRRPEEFKWEDLLKFVGTGLPV